MNNRPSNKTDAQRAAAIVAAAGGKLVGRTRLQKLGYLLELTGLGDGFNFYYKHYGPYCDELALGARDAGLLGFISEEEHLASWGGTYSVFTTSQVEPNPVRQRFAEVAAAANAIELELAATAAFLSTEAGIEDPWAETAVRKPDKAAEGRLEHAKALYAQLVAIQTPRVLPTLF